MDEYETSFALEDPESIIAPGSNRPFMQWDIGQVALYESTPWYRFINLPQVPKTPSNRHQYPGIPPYAEVFKYLSLLSAPLANRNSKPYRNPKADASYSAVNAQLNRLYGGVSGPVPPIGLNYSGS